LLFSWCFLVGRLNVGLDDLVLILGLTDGDNIGHNLDDLVLHHDLGTLHNLDLKTEDTLAELDVADSAVNEVVLGLTSGDLVTSSVLLGLGALTTDFTGDHNLATGGTTTAHNSADNVVGGVTDGDTVQELGLEGLNVVSSGEGVLESEGLDGELDAVVLIVETIALLDEGLEFLNLLDGSVEELLGLSGEDANLGLHVGSTDLNTAITFLGKAFHEELVELSLENTIGNELALG